MKFIPLVAIVAFLSLAYLFLPNQIVETAYADDKNNGSTIAGVNVSGLDREEIQQALQTAIDEWVSQPMIVSGGGTEIEIDASAFVFDIDATISLYETMVDKPWYAFWKAEKIVHLPLEILPSDEIQQRLATVGDWETDETYSLVEAQASFLKEHQIEAIHDATQFEDERIAIIIEGIPENSKGITEITEVLNNSVVGQGELFSYTEKIGEQFNNANSTTLNFVASMIYSAVLQTEYDIVERHQQKQIPTYIDPGQEASISLANSEDLKFVNSSDNVAKLKLTIDGNSLKAEIYSEIKGKTVTLRTVKDKISPRIVNRYSDKLAIGKQTLVQEGVEGLRVETYRTISESGNTTEKLVSRDYYPPKNRIVLKSSRQPITNSNTENPTSEKKDEKLELDLNGDGLPDYEMEKPKDENDLPPGSYYDKAGNLITP